jgi:hypothetical protein
VLETYKDVHPKIRFLHISLAHFESMTQSSDSTTGYSESVIDIEGKVLNQHNSDNGR